MSIRLRLTAWYVLTLAIALGAVGLALVLVFRTAMERQLDGELEARAATLVANVQAEQGTLTLQGQNGEDSFVVGGEFVGLYDRSGSLLDSSVAPPSASRAIATFAAGASVARSETVTSGTEHLRVRAEPVLQSGRPIATVAVARSLAPIDAAVRQLLGILGLTLPLAVAIAAVGGYLLAYRALRPVEQLRRAAEDYGANDLSRRLAPKELRDDELGRLARTLDAMLDRVAAAVEQQRRFTGDASHELRTPIATILADASLSLERSRSADEQRATIKRIESDAGRMARIVEGLLLLARADSRTKPTTAEEVEARELIDASVRRVTARAAERNVRIETRIEPGLRVTDRDASLERVIDNLLDNALRHGPGGSAITIEAAAHGGRTRITVADRGPGVPAEERARIFERFHRSPGAAGAGAGLGLAIARTIVDAHAGTIEVIDTPGGGATFVVELPARPRAR
jgi:signal transduction histidine kinase